MKSLPGGAGRIGLESDQLRLMPYNPQWPQYYERERRHLQAAIGQFVTDIQHVGSTAIAGMPAKPVIDIGIAVENFERAAVCVSHMERLGYEYRGENGILRRHYFVKGHPRTHHVHMLEAASAEWRAHISFRDYLRAHRGVAIEYANLKNGLAMKFATDREAYQRAKASFIAEVIAKAGPLCPQG